jgi:PAS domain S-box-containing protein
MIAVLCVDDESAHLEITKRFLEEHGELAVTTALSAQEALMMMETNRFDAVVSDYQMPGMDGIAFLRAVRPKNPYLPFILFTGKGREEVVIEAFTSGTDFYLQKGGKPEILFAGLADTIKKAVKISADRKAFHNSEIRYRRLFETSPDGILIVDAESGKISEANPLVLTLLGYTREEILGKNIWDLGVIREKSLAEQAAAELKTTGYIRYDNLPVKTKDGRDIAVELVSNTYDVETQRVVQCNIRDITERRRAEEEHGRLAAIVEGSDEAIIGKTLDGIITSWNAGAERIYGYPAQEIIGRSVSLLVPPDQPDDTRSVLDQIRNGEPVIRYETLRRKKDGGQIHVTLIISPIKDAQGRCIGVSTISHDITGRKMTEEALKKTMTLLNDVGAMAHVGGWELDVATKEVLWTKETYRIHEIPEDMKLDLSRVILFYDLPERGMLETALQRCTENGESFDIELPFTSNRGRHLWTRVWGRAVKAGDVVVTLTGTFQDITGRKAAEEALRAFGGDLDRRVAERTTDITDENANLMSEIRIRLDAERQLEKTVGEKEVLLREVHHRVKNNLQIIISVLNLQSRYIKDEITLAAFRESQNRVRAMALVHEKLYQSADVKNIDFGNYIRFLGKNLFQFFGMTGKGVTLSMDIQDIFLAIDTAIPVGLMINELISNSLKYAFPEERSGEISLAIHRQDHTLTILIKDNGIGIPMGFDWRNAESLGLRLVVTLVEQLDGTIELDRRAGTTFTIVVKVKE